MYARQRKEQAPLRATVQLEGPLLRYAAVLLPGGLHEPGPDGALLCHLSAFDFDALASLVASLGKHATVIHPYVAREALLVNQILSELWSP